MLRRVATLLAVSIVEDDAAVRDALRVLLNGTPGFRCASTHADAADALAQLPQKNVDAVLVDINLPGASGIECVRRLKRLKPSLSLIMFTVHEDRERLFESLAAGANGYILKHTPPAEILTAIREVVAGGAPLSPSIARRVLQHFHRAAPAKDELEKLSPRESEILHQLSVGYTAKEIGGTLGLSGETVRNHLKSIYAKLHVHNRTEAVVKYLGR